MQRIASGFGSLKIEFIVIMKVNIIKYTVLALGLGYASLDGLMAQSAIDSNYVFSGYTDRMSVFNKMPVSSKSIIFLGDSLTEAGRWRDIAPEYPLLNRGISGDISFGVYARLNEILRHHPQKIFLMIGVNDLKRKIPTSYIIRNNERIVAKIRKESPKTKIYLNSILPVNNTKLIESFKSVKNSDIEQLNEGLKQISRYNKNVQFVDLHKIFADQNGELRAEVTPDGIHLEVSAYVEMINYLKQIKAL